MSVAAMSFALMPSMTTVYVFMSCRSLVFKRSSTIEVDSTLKHCYVIESAHLKVFAWCFTCLEQVCYYDSFWASIWIPGCSDLWCSYDCGCFLLHAIFNISVIGAYPHFKQVFDISWRHLRTVSNRNVLILLLHWGIGVRWLLLRVVFLVVGRVRSIPSEEAIGFGSIWKWIVLFLIYTITILKPM